MSLDKNLFTLTFTPHKDNPNVIDLVDPSGTVHYRKQRVAGSQEYRIELYDPTSQSLLATAYAPSASSKTKTIELCNPTCKVEIRYTGTLSFRWSFKWEDHELEWKREECFIVRKPDPPVIVSITKEPAGRLKTTTVQILDYNLNRFDIDDRKGLEIVILVALLTFSDANEAFHTPTEAPSLGNPLSRTASAAPPAQPKDVPPPTPPKPAPKTGVDRIAELQAMKGEYNEVIISDEGSVADYAAYCNTLLQDDALLFVTLKSAEAEQVPKVLQVVEEAKRIRYKAGLDEEQLHQYVLYDQKEQKKGPRIINLDDDRKNKYAPPKNLTVHLSKIAMPELQPKAVGSNSDKNGKNGSNKKDEKKAPPKQPQPKPDNIPKSFTKSQQNRPPKQSHSPLRPADTKQAPSPSQPSKPAFYAPRPNKVPRSSTPERRQNEPNLYPPHSSVSNSSQHLRPPNPMPGSWPGTTPSPSPPPPTGDQKPQGNVASITQGASTVVHGILGIITSGKLR